MLGKLALASFLGLLIGTERGLIAKQPAGTRTFSLVALATCLLVVVGNHVNAQVYGIMNFDPTHLAGSIVQGVGFLGAGLIIFRGDSIHGITTAAGLWLTAAIGIAVGFGLYLLSIFGTLLMIIILTGMWFVEHQWKDWFTTHRPDTENPLGR